MTKKLIAIILIISVITSIGFNIFLFKPQKVKAIFGLGDIVIDIVNQIKDWVLDEIPRRIARHMMLRLQEEITRWAQGGFTDENKPFALLNWKNYVYEALNLASAKFIEEFHLTPLCAPFRFTIGQELGFAQPYYTMPPYTIYAACTIQDIVGNAAEFWENPSISTYGWDTWMALTRSENNLFGSILLAAERLAELQNEETKEKEVQKDTGQGYMHEQKCVDEQKMTDEQLEECRNNCFEEVDPNNLEEMDACLAECDTRNTGICLEYSTTNIGSTIHSAIEKATGSDFDWLITADEITKMFGIVFSSLFNKLLHGTGLASQPFYRAGSTTASYQQYQNQYAYYQQYKANQTQEDKDDLRRDILDNILKAMQRMTTNAYECDTDFQLTGSEYADFATSILEEESQHLYVGYEGINLKPDYEVLDPPNAPFRVYGTTWEEIPLNKYPEKCFNIAGQTCLSINTRLPFNLRILNIDSRCEGCIGAINTYRKICAQERDNCLAQCAEDDNPCKQACRAVFDVCENNAIRSAVNDGDCVSFLLGTQCLEGAKLINKTENRCEDCIEQGQVKCEYITNQAERESCIELYCSNFEDINADWTGGNILSAQDFYERCLTAQLKESCNICLKEYFMPHQYCVIIYDFINRAFVKYPALVKYDSWWGIENTTVKNQDPEDCYAVGYGTSGESIYTGLLCRILPNWGGGAFCEQYCPEATEEELRITYDDEPRDNECIGPILAGEYMTASVVVNAYHPGGQYIEWTIKKGAKCCAALTGNKTDLWNQCRGISIGSAEGCDDSRPVDAMPGCYCAEGWRPLGFARTGEPTTTGSRGGDCHGFDFIMPNDSPSGNNICMYTNANPETGEEASIATGSGCREITPGQDCDLIDGTPARILANSIINISGSGLHSQLISLIGGNTYSASVYDRKVENCEGSGTGLVVCARCPDDCNSGPGEDGCPYYGTNNNQCYGKVISEPNTECW